MVKSNLDALAQAWLLVCWSLVSHFYFRINFSEKDEFNWEASCKTIRIWWFCDPSKTDQSLVEKLFGSMSFEKKIMGGKKIKNVLIISEAKLRLMSQFSIKVYVGYTPPNHRLMMMGHRQNTFFLARPKGYTNYTHKNLGNAYPQSAGALCVAMIMSIFFSRARPKIFLPHPTYLKMAETAIPYRECWWWKWA